MVGCHIVLDQSRFTGVIVSAAQLVAVEALRHILLFDALIEEKGTKCRNSLSINAKGNNHK